MLSRTTRWVGLALLLAGCDERARLTFPSDEPGDEVGPVTTIDHPGRDTVIVEGDLVVLAGRTHDNSGVDTVYFMIAGSNQTFLPFAAEGEDTVTFGLPISTIGLSGSTVTVEILGVDLEGHRGSSATRRLSIE
jgi:Bacterial Ig domain